MLPQGAPPVSGSWWAREPWRPKYQPSALPTTTSEGKCCLAVTRVIVIAEANPYAAVWLSQPGYSCAQTLAMDQAIAECSEVKDAPPLKKSPLWFPSRGRCLCVTSLNRYVTPVLLIAASALRRPASCK